MQKLNAFVLTSMYSNELINFDGLQKEVKRKYNLFSYSKKSLEFFCLSLLFLFVCVEHDQLLGPDNLLDEIQQ